MHLTLVNNTIADFGPLRGLTQVELLRLDGNGLRDLSGLEGMVGLRELWLWNNLITDLAPLVANVGLGTGDRVSLVLNPLSMVALTHQVPALRARGVEVELR